LIWLHSPFKFGDLDDYETDPTTGFVACLDSVSTTKSKQCNRSTKASYNPIVSYLANCVNNYLILQFMAVCDLMVACG